MKGYRTIAVGLILAIAPAGLSYLAGVDWSQYVSPSVAMALSGACMVLLRVVTDTPVGRDY